MKIFIYKEISSIAVDSDMAENPDGRVVTESSDGVSEL